MEEGEGDRGRGGGKDNKDGMKNGKGREREGKGGGKANRDGMKDRIG